MATAAISKNDAKPTKTILLFIIFEFIAHLHAHNLFYIQKSGRPGGRPDLVALFLLIPETPTCRTLSYAHLSLIFEGLLVFHVNEMHS